MGTPGYMAPEQAMGDNVDHRADLYALGVCLWELLVGRVLYESHDLTQIVTRQLTEKPQSPREASGDSSIPDELDDLVMALLSHKPVDRPGSASVVRDLLRQISFGSSITGVRPILPRDSDASQRVSSKEARADGVAATVLAGDTGSLRVPTANLPTTKPFPPPKVLALGCAALLSAGVLVSLLLSTALSGGDETTHIDKPVGAPSGGFMGGIFERAEEAVRPVPPEVREQVDLMQDAPRLRERRRAARWLVAYDPPGDVPEWALATARMINTRTCEEKRAEVARIVTLGADEALPTLIRMHQSPPNQCGPFFRRTDCFGCMREELREAIEDLGGDPAEPIGD
jgi:serine/threonine-protein kinase